MKVVIDSYALLGAIGGNQHAFSVIDELVKKQAAALLAARLKHKSLDLPTYRSIVKAIGNETFELYLDTVDDRFLKTVAKKVDQHAPEVKGGDGDVLRQHLISLAKEKIEPTPKPSRPRRPKKKTTTSSKTARSASSERPHAIATKPPRRS